MLERFELNTAGVGELLKSSEVCALIASEAQARAATLGEGYASDVRVGANRASARIYTTTKEAYNDNLESNVLLSVL